MARCARRGSVHRRPQGARRATSAAPVSDGTLLAKAGTTATSGPFSRLSKLFRGFSLGVFADVEGSITGGPGGIEAASGGGASAVAELQDQVTTLARTATGGEVTLGEGTELPQ